MSAASCSPTTTASVPVVPGPAPIAARNRRRDVRPMPAHRATSTCGPRALAQRLDGRRRGGADRAVPSEPVHGQQLAHLSEACEKLILGNRTRFKLELGWRCGVQPLLWAMYRKMWAWGTVIFVFEILLPVVLITLGAQDGVSNKVSYLRVVPVAREPPVLAGDSQEPVLSPCAAHHHVPASPVADLRIRHRHRDAGGTSRTSAFVGMVLAIVVSLLAWSIVDTLHAKFMRCARRSACRQN